MYPSQNDHVKSSEDNNVQVSDDMGEKESPVHVEAADTTRDNPLGLTPEERILSKKLVRKIDALIMPTILIIYLMNWIDRNNYAAARLQGLEDDLNMTPTQYQTGLSILFVGYILGQIPSNMLMDYFGRPAIYLSFWTIAWGVVSALTCLVKNFTGILVCRFILGFVEAPLFPGVLYYLSRWYTKSELNLRMSVFYSGALIAGAFGNLIAAGILNGLAGKAGLSAWQWLYIVEGAITVGIGICAFFILPDFPQTWRALSPELKSIAFRRMKLDSIQSEEDDEGGQSQLMGFKLAFTDIKVYILAGAYVAITGTAGFQLFFPTLTRTLGFNNTTSLLLVAPPYIFLTFFTYLHGYLSDRFNSRFWFWVYPIPITIVGFLIFMFVSDFGPKYFSMFLMMFVYAMNGTLYSWLAGLLPRPPAKRAVAYAFVNAMGNSASIWISYVYRDQDAPYFRPAMGLNIALQLVAAGLGLWLRLIARQKNSLLERMERNGADLSAKDVAALRKMAKSEGTDVETFRRGQTGYRYAI